MKKKALSTVVSTLLLVLLVIAVIAIVWVTVNNLVKKEIISSESCFGITGKLTFNKAYTCLGIYDPAPEMSCESLDLDCNGKLEKNDAEKMVNLFVKQFNFEDISQIEAECKSCENLKNFISDFSNEDCYRYDTPKEEIFYSCEDLSKSCVKNINLNAEIIPALNKWSYCVKNVQCSYNSATESLDCVDVLPAQISISTKDLEMEKILVSISSSGETKSFEIFEGAKIDYVKDSKIQYGDELSLPGKNSGKTYTINLLELLPSATDGKYVVKISPIINGEQCGVTDTLVLEDC